MWGYHFFFNGTLREFKEQIKRQPKSLRVGSKKCYHSSTTTKYIIQKMKKLIFYAALVCSLLAVQTAVAQNPVTTLEHNGTSQVFYGLNSLVDAYEASVNGDSLYLSTGYFTAPASIAKRINIIGAGHFPDSLNVAKRTNLLVINGGINLRYGADSLRLEGLYINGGIGFNNWVNYVKVIRCWTTNVSFDNSSINNNNNCTFEECFVQGEVGKHKGINLCIKNSIINTINSIDANALIMRIKG